MKNFYLRLILLLVTFPVLFVLIFILPHYHHLGFNLLVTVAAFVACFEIEELYRKKVQYTSRLLVPVLGGSLPLITYFEIIGIIPANSIFIWLIFCFILLFGRGIFIKSEDRIETSLNSISASILNVVYPGLFLSYIVRLSEFENSSYVILIFVSMVFFNDIMAYLAGKISRGKTRLNLVISPNKSLIGFIAGFLQSVITSVFFFSVFSHLFDITLFEMIVIGIIIGISTITGDLVESVMKRSAAVKDTGTILIGRGGIMDTIDSILLSAPIFYYLLLLLN